MLSCLICPRKRNLAGSIFQASDRDDKHAIVKTTAKLSGFDYDFEVLFSNLSGIASRLVALLDEPFDFYKMFCFSFNAITPILNSIMAYRPSSRCSTPSASKP